MNQSMNRQSRKIMLLRLLLATPTTVAAVLLLFGFSSGIVEVRSFSLLDLSSGRRRGYSYWPSQRFNRIRQHHAPVMLSSSSSSSKLKDPSVTDGADSTSPSSSSAATFNDDNSDDNSDDNGKRQQHVIVVGGGVGGLAVAARVMAACGDDDAVRVTILEKNHQVGGRCGSFWVDVVNDSNSNTTSSSSSTHRIRHERGPSLLLLPDVYRQLFTDTTGKNAEDFGLTIRQCLPAYQVVFEDGDCISVGFPSSVTASDKSLQRQEESSRAKMNLYEPNGSDKWDEYMAITSAFLDCGLPNFIEERLDLKSFPNFLVQSLKDSAKAWPLKPHSDVLDSIFESNKLKALASFQDLYVGLEPYKNSKLFAGGVLQSTAPAVFGLLAAIELHPNNKKAGVFAPIGGFQAVTDAMERLVDELGVTVQCDTTVTGVNNDGVYICDGQEGERFFPADLVIVNADLPYAKKSLIKSSKDTNRGSSVSALQDTYDWDDGFSFSSGVVAFHWSLDKELDDLNTHNVFLVARSRSQAEASWQVLRPSNHQGNNSRDHAAFNFYVHRAAATDPSVSPKGYDAIMVLVPCKTLLRDEECAQLPRAEAMNRYRQQFPDTLISEMRAVVLERLGAIDSLADLEKHIIHEVVDTPSTWAEQFNLAAGTPFGLSHGFAQLSLTRPAPESSGMSNALFCGASTRPGNGVPLVLIGAKQVAEKASKRLAAKMSPRELQQSNQDQYP